LPQSLAKNDAENFARIPGYVVSISSTHATLRATLISLAILKFRRKLGILSVWHGH
jgi:hypothetical protein